MVLSIHGRGGPEQVETAHLTDAEALARRIGASSARLLVLLDYHTMEIPDELLENSPRQILMAGGVSRYYAEAQSEEESRRKPFKLRASFQVSPQVQAILDKKMPGFSYKRIGAHTVSYEESMARFRKEVGTKTLVDQFLIRVARWNARLKPMDKVPEAHLLDIVDNIWIQLNGGDLTRCDYFLNHSSNQNTLQAMTGGSSYDWLLQDLNREWSRLCKIMSEQRDAGKADEYSVNSIMKTLGAADRAVIVHGFSHGVIDGNPASLPDQLARQVREVGQADSSIEILMLVDRENSQDIHRILTGHIVTKGLREGVVACDYQLRRNSPLLEWLKEAPQLYGWANGKGVAPRAPSP